MNASENYSSHYFNQEVCDQERNATGVYLGILGSMLCFSFYFLISVSLALSRTKAPSDANCTLQYASILRGLLIAVITTINIRLILDLTQLGMGSSGYGAFGGLFLSKAVLSTVNSACVYAFLWLRQWVLYDQPILRKVKTTTFKIFNIFVLILVVAMVAAGPAVEVRYVKLELTEDGCMLVRTNRWGLALGIYTAFSLFYQLILLGFFIYPVKQTHRHSHNAVGNADTSTVAPIVKRCTIAAAACFLDEVVFMAVHNLIERPVMLNTISTDLKLIVYYVCLVASYNDWREKFCIPCGAKPVLSHSLSRVGTDFKSKLSSDDFEAKTLRGDRNSHD